MQKMPRIKISMKFINTFLQYKKNRRPKNSKKKKPRYDNFPTITTEKRLNLVSKNFTFGMCADHTTVWDMLFAFGNNRPKCSLALRLYIDQ